SYGGVEGDSASVAELVALLSAIGNVPVKQSLAVTGSVDQRGKVQAIGGVNQKIEGFFDICKARELTGSQGVLIPADNVQHLMLRGDVVDAIREDRFRVYPIATADEAIAVLTGVPAGPRDSEGNFPDGSVNRRVEDALRELAEQRRQFTAKGESEGAEEDKE
ncbi:MAG: ATP-dependent protease, partial [Pseudomonas stutzeri]|nr:ATP-dependent protease [Stutzerimonas stutzeri]